MQGSNAGRDKRYSLLQNVLTGAGAQHASYTMGTGMSYAGGKAAGA
jgi:hypothetical protein